MQVFYIESGENQGMYIKIVDVLIKKFMVRKFYVLFL